MLLFLGLNTLKHRSSLLLIGDLAKLDRQELFCTDVISYDRFDLILP